MAKYFLGLLVLFFALNGFAVVPKGVTLPDEAAYQNFREHRRAISDDASTDSPSRMAALAVVPEVVQKKILVLLVEFGGTNTFMWTPGVSTWDPIGDPNMEEWDGTNYANASASRYFAEYHGITGPTNFTYVGPMHNQIERPAAEDSEYREADRIWCDDFSPDYYQSICFGNGTVFDYRRQDGTPLYADCSGVSVSNYYDAMSNGRLVLDGDVFGWVRLTNSAMYYAADDVPGCCSVPDSVYIQLASEGANPDGGSPQDLVVDACRAAAKQYPDLDWSDYDLDGDGEVDSLWILVAGREEPVTNDENLMWPHSWAVFPSVEIADGISVGRYTLNTEDCGVYVLAHEFGHNLGAIDLYSYTGGEPSIVNWSVMHSTRGGTPFEYNPVSMDPYHLDGWGWLDPVEISDSALIVTQEIFQAGSRAPDGETRAVRVRLDDQQIELPVSLMTNAATYWRGGQEHSTSVELQLPEVQVGGSNAVLSLQTAYEVETDYDFLMAAVSVRKTDGWSAYRLLSNEHTQSQYESGLDFTFEGPFAGLCGKNESFPDYSIETFSLAAYTGQTVRVGIFYSTDGGVELEGPYIGEISLDLADGGAPMVFSSDDPQGAINDGWEVSDGFLKVAHYYYLQWRNTSQTGGFDWLSSRFDQPLTSGLLVWYVNERYQNNNLSGYLSDVPSFGPKGVCMVVDSHPQVVSETNVFRGRACSNPLMDSCTRVLCKDAPFGLRNTNPLDVEGHEGYPGRSFFTDSRNYGAGVEYTYLNPLSVPPQFEWAVRKWDQSVVIPSSKAYSVFSPRKPADSDVYRVWSETDSLGEVHAYFSAEPDALAGGMGNPVDAGGEKGWNFQVLEDRGTSAVVRIWNSLENGPWPVLIESVGEGATVPADDFLADTATSNQVVCTAATNHVISKLLWNGTEVVAAAGNESYTLDPGAVAADSAVYVFFEPVLVDGSGISKQWLTDHGIEPSTAGLAGDADKDGLSNAEEFVAGTDPNDAESCLVVSTSGGDLRWRSEWNHRYRLWSSTNLLDGFVSDSDWIDGEYEETLFHGMMPANSCMYYKVEVISGE